jgi:hypothetical protein
MTGLFICNLRPKHPASSCRKHWSKKWARPADKRMCRTSCYENAEMRDPSTMHGIAITHFCVAWRQGVKDRPTFINTLSDHDIHMWQQACAVLLHTFTTSMSCHNIMFTDEYKVNLGTKSDLLTSGLNKFTFFEVVWGSWNLDMGDWKTDSSK